MMKRMKKRAAALCGAVLLTVFAAAFTLTAYAAEKPEIAAQGAALYNATTGEFLFGKNENHQYYPASITKVMTALLVLENSGLDEMVTFTDSATKNLESGAVSLDVTTGDVIPVRDCLYGLLLKSANEVANGLAEHVAGSVPAFADKMNEKAKALGCTATNFVNPNGLNNASHLTTPHDMALITAACFDNAAFREIEKSTTYHFPATQNRPDGTNITMGHKMISPSSSQHYEGILGGKTGYTSKAGNTLVTCAERNGVRLVAVVMKSAGTHYTDTRKLLNYGFEVAGSGSENTVKSIQSSPESAGSPESAASKETTASTGTAVEGPGAAISGTPAESAAETAAETKAETVAESKTEVKTETSSGTVMPSGPSAMESGAAETSPAETSAAETGSSVVVGTAPGGEQN
ncbi:MAG: D-alanyl-D-alanine carboxypeptidase [Stomatobaculum sp.]|nr:D-alanyl-D-alanine carboxypeptidase [Stomatobaculum sp.]